METKVQNSVKQHTEVNGIILTPQAAETLKLFQDNNNHALNRSINNIAEMVCYLEMLLSHEIDHDSELVETGRNHLGKLIGIREDLKLLAKP
jgi:hypothetical protein